MLRAPFVDIDRLLEIHFAKEEGQTLSCREIFRAVGEKEFRLLEKRAVFSITAEMARVIATGGGTLLDAQNREHLRSLGKVVYLKGGADFLFRRTVQGGIPAYLDPGDPEGSFLKLAKERTPHYAQAADLTFEVGDLAAEEIAERLLLAH